MLTCTEMTIHKSNAGVTEGKDETIEHTQKIKKIKEVEES